MLAIVRIARLLYTIIKNKFVTKAGLSDIVAILILRDIYNKFARIQYTIINKLILVDKVLAELVDNSFFLAYKVNCDGSSNRLRYVFFIYS